MQKPRMYERLAAFLTLIFAGTLVAYAASAPAPARQHPAKITNVTLPAAQHDADELLVDSHPVNGEAGAADEPPLPSALPKAIKSTKLSTTSHRRTLRMEVTAYCPCPLCCGAGAHGVTASGHRVTWNGGRFVAADTDVLPFGTRLIIPGYNNGRAVPVADRGGAIQGNRLDLFFPTHAQALQWGRRIITVTIVD